jgi:hypothetical protein
MEQPSYSAIVQSSETMTDNRIRQVLRFKKDDGRTQNSGPIYRFPIGSLPPEGLYFYLNTWLKLIDSNAADGVLATNESQDFRISIYPAATTAITGAIIRAKAILGSGPGDNGRVKQISNEWQEYSFLLFIPQKHQNRFLEIRLFVPNDEKAVIIDMTDVELIEVPAPDSE